MGLCTLLGVRKPETATERDGHIACSTAATLNFNKNSNCFHEIKPSLSASIDVTTISLPLQVACRSSSHCLSRVETPLNYSMYTRDEEDRHCTPSLNTGPVNLFRRGVLESTICSNQASGASYESNSEDTQNEVATVTLQLMPHHPNSTERGMSHCFDKDLYTAIICQCAAF
ncbi:hypothetical protein J6590_016014 [Homalodisca vitripennis]|nr:hypothetical protein J6590_016014 [Homalodisca vitripennis]